ncbi:MAG: hypothetical protein WEB89_04280, partial [Balneolales bacterium]
LNVYCLALINSFFNRTQVTKFSMEYFTQPEMILSSREKASLMYQHTLLIFPCGVLFLVRPSTIGSTFKC